MAMCSPQKVLIMPADYVGQCVLASEEIEGGGFTVILGIDNRTGAVSGRQGLIHARDLRRQFGPAVHIGKIAGQGGPALVLGGERFP